MLQILLFAHLFAVGMLFAGLGIEHAALYSLMRARTVADVRSALLNTPAIAALMGGGVLLLIAAGISLIYVTGFGWSPSWIGVVFLVTIALAIVGPVNNGRRIDAIHALAQQAADGPLGADIESLRRHPMLHYGVWLTTLEIVAALFIMAVKPGTPVVVTVAIAAGVLAFLPARLAVREPAQPSAAHV